jgi:hypothetical protein
VSDTDRYRETIRILRADREMLRDVLSRLLPVAEEHFGFWVAEVDGGHLETRPIVFAQARDILAATDGEA